MQMDAYDKAELQRERNDCLRVLRKMLKTKDDHMTACDRIMGATHPCTCGAEKGRELLRRARREKW